MMHENPLSHNVKLAEMHGNETTETETEQNFKDSWVHFSNCVFRCAQSLQLGMGEVPENKKI